MKKPIKKYSKWPRGIRIINVPLLEYDPEKAFAKVLRMNIPKPRSLVFQITRYTQEPEFQTYPEVQIHRY